jgi:biotin carboxyl carrier protein
VIVEIELDGTRRRVTVRRSADGWVADIEGREVEVSVVGRSTLVMPPDLRPGGGSHATNDPVVAAGFSRKSYDIAFEPGWGGELIVHVNGVAVPLTVLDRRRHGRRGGTDDGTDTRPHTIVTPMPGRIVKVLVKTGEAVAARQPLLVVEAMKMENELRAPRAGIVADVRVAEGASVEANTVLMVLK